MYLKADLETRGIEELRDIMREKGGTPRTLKKEQIINAILLLQSGKMEGDKNNLGRKSRKEKNQQRQKEAGKNSEFNMDGKYDVKVEEDEDKYEVINLRDSKVSGVMEFHDKGFAFLRGENYESNFATDVHVSKTLIKNYRLRRGDYIEGVAERENDNPTPSLKTISKLNGKDFNVNIKRPYFDDLTPCYPEERISLELDGGKDVAIRAIDLMCPIGKGQRGLIVAPPKAGKTTLLKKIANSIEEKYKDIKLIILLIEERPEEVTDFKRSVQSEVIYSTFDESPDHHVRVAELVLNRAKRLVEMGEDVVILLDSITKLARAYNAVLPSSGKTLSGGIDPLALQEPKKFFGSARNIENGGSLTILSTALIETGSKMDDVIYEEFKGTGNMELILSRELSERRIFPAIDLYRSGTRKEELLLTEEELEASYQVRRYLDKDLNASQNLLDMLKKTKTNKEFTEKAPIWCKMMNN